MKIVIVGSGFAGATFARLAADRGHASVVYESRPHWGGNAWDHAVAGVNVHAYGPHYFRSDNAEVLTFLSRFTKWNRTIYRVMSEIDGSFIRFPLSSATYEDLYGMKLAPAEWQAELASRRLPRAEINNAEDWLLANVGREFYELFYEGYTAKQWGVHPRELSPRVVARIPIYLDDTWQYVKTKFQALPADGYAALFENMLDHPLIQVKTSSPWDGRRGDLTIYTGPLDAFFKYRFGRLPYRSLEFKTEVLDQERFQPCGQVNYPDAKISHTRTIEWKLISGQRSNNTVVTWEHPRAEGEPYYPMQTQDAAKLAQSYRMLAAAERNVEFIGRQATYQYLNMDQAILQAMRSASSLLSAVQPEAGVARMPL
jgi:UDP-galactopyranose mutase